LTEGRTQRKKGKEEKKEKERETEKEIQSVKLFTAL